MTFTFSDVKLSAWWYLHLEKGDSSAQVLIGLKFSADVSFLSDAMKVDDEIGMS